MIVQGVATTGGSSPTTITLPAHQPGDMIIIFNQQTIAPVAPSAGGTVPNWINIQGAAANSLGLRAVYCIATASNHTSGTWAGSTFIVIVLRPASGNTLSIGGSNVGAANNTQTVVYPAATFTKLDGTSWSIRCGIRNFSDIDIANNLPSGYILQGAAGISAPANPTMAVSSRSGIIANPIADSVSVPGTNSPYRAQTIEVVETGPPVPTDETVIDSFNRADAEVHVGAPNLWLKPSNFSASNTLYINSNLLSKRDGGPASHGVSIFQLASNFDLLIDCVANPLTASIDTFGIEFCGQFAYVGDYISWCGYSLDIQDYDPTWRLRELLVGGTYGVTLFSVNGLAMPAAGDTLWIKKSGTTIIVYRRLSGGVFTEVGRGTNSMFNRAGRIRIEFQGLNTADPQRWDNLRGGPLEAIPAFPEYSIVDDFNRTNRTPPGSRWLGTYRANGLQVLSNQLTNVADLWDGMYWDSQPVTDADVRVTVVTVGASTEFFQFHLHRELGADTGYVISFTPTGVEIYRRIYGTDVLIASNYTLTVAAGNEIGASIKGSKISAWHKPTAGTYGVVATATNTEIPGAGVISIFSNGGWIVDNFYSGPPPYVQQVVAAI